LDNMLRTFFFIECYATFCY